MSRTTIDEYVDLLDEAFVGIDQPWHSVLNNLASATEDDWLWVPPGGARRIRAIASHVGGAVWLYYDRVFGGYKDFGDPITSWSLPAGDLGVSTDDLESLAVLKSEPAMADVVAWVTSRHRAFRDAVAALADDAALAEVRTNHRGNSRPVRWFIGTMLQHYSYHAGEINHIRALHQGDDGGS